MTTIVAIQNSFKSIKSAKVVDEMSGSRIEIEFENGAKVWICPDNDAVHYWSPIAGRANIDESSVQLMVPLGAGMHDEMDDKPHIGTRCGFNLQTF